MPIDQSYIRSFSVKGCCKFALRKTTQIGHKFDAEFLHQAVAKLPTKITTAKSQTFRLYQHQGHQSGFKTEGVVGPGLITGGVIGSGLKAGGV